MTVANLVVEPHRARLVADTVGYIGKTPAVMHRKIRTSPTAGLAFMARGRSILAGLLEERSRGWASFETAVGEVRAALEIVPSAYLCDGDIGAVSLLGWTGDRPRVARISSRLRGQQRVVEYEEIGEGVHLAPGLGSHSIPTALTDDQLVKVAILQQEISVKHGCNLCIGGDIEVAEVTAAGVIVRKIGSYPDKVLTQARIAKADALALEEVAA